MNTFANQTLPQALIVSLRDDRPVNLVSALKNQLNQQMVMAKSIEKLSKEYTRVEKFMNKPLLTFYVTLDENESLKTNW